MTSDERPRKEDGSGLTEIDTRPIIFEPVSGAHLARTMNHNDPRKLFPHLRGRPYSFQIPSSNFISFLSLPGVIVIVIENGKTVTIKRPSSFLLRSKILLELIFQIRTTFRTLTFHF